MKRNSRRSLALHTLGHIAGDPDRMRKSARIADHAGANPVVVRRGLGRLREAGHLISEKDHPGGSRRARSPQQITLDDAHLALEGSPIAEGSEEKAIAELTELGKRPPANRAQGPATP